MFTQLYNCKLHWKEVDGFRERSMKLLATCSRLRCTSKLCVCVLFTLIAWVAHTYSQCLSAFGKAREAVFVLQVFISWCEADVTVMAGIFDGQYFDLVGTFIAGPCEKTLFGGGV